MRPWLLLPLLIGLSGCGTITSWASGCPGPYSGVRTDTRLIAHAVGPTEPSPGPQVSLGLDGPLGDAWDVPFLALDVPLAAAADTVTLPLGWTLRREPTPAGLACAP